MQEAIRRTAWENKWAKVRDETLDPANRIPARVTGAGESLQKQVEPHFTPGRIEVSVLVRAGSYALVKTRDFRPTSRHTCSRASPGRFTRPSVSP